MLSAKLFRGAGFLAGLSMIAVMAIESQPLSAQASSGQAAEAPAPSLPKASPPLEIKRFLVPSETLLIDLPTALKLVHCNSLDLAILQQRYAMAQVDEDIAKFAILPDLSIGPRYESHSGAIQDVAGKVINVDKSSLFTGGLLSFNWEPGKIFFEPLAARLRRETSGENYNDALRNTALDAALKYYDVVRAQYQVAIQRFQVQRSGDLAAYYAQQFELGQALKADYLRLKAQQDTAEAALVTAEMEREQAVQRLLATLRLDHSIDLVTVGPDLSRKSMLDIDVDADTLVRHAFAGRSDLREAEKQVEIARTNLTNKGVSPFLPTPFFTYSAGKFSGSADGESSDGGGRSDFAASFQWSLKNLGMGNRFEYERTWYLWAIACLQEIQLREKIDQEVREALIVARASRKLIELRDAALPTAREALELSEVRLRSGEGLALDVLQAQQVLTQAESEYINALIAYDRAQVLLWNRLRTLMPVDSDKKLEKKSVFELKTYTGLPESEVVSADYSTTGVVNLDDSTTETLQPLLPADEETTMPQTILLPNTSQTLEIKSALEQPLVQKL